MIVLAFFAIYLKNEWVDKIIYPKNKILII